MRPSPLTAEEWIALVADSQLPPQQARVVELILRGFKDKEIASEMGISFPTVRTYLARIFARFDVSDRSGVILRLFDLHNRRCRARR
jgi:DNA-binding NarL/FixJ family response regulator